MEWSGEWRMEWSGVENGERRMAWTGVENGERRMEWTGVENGECRKRERLPVLKAGAKEQRNCKYSPEVRGPSSFGDCSFIILSTNTQGVSQRSRHHTNNKDHTRVLACPVTTRSITSTTGRTLLFHNNDNNNVTLCPLSPNWSTWPIIKQRSKTVPPKI